ncbi:MAG TPA: SpoIIE family protein phosphatase [Leptospiraceae bacterium]|nr:SpoIIE family protein phosphatase [Leptospirales bacterium]HMU83212.1 SpoIIE family protein phosphatase [Leptospiraceae bacterium]HMX55138.1 SpoIIE family protein phosphatase [Leptospiraceae bacterium]HMY44193.1 SpoIIE family protein phosphatase [Leptospiraceae bacterium]HMZ36363.1 SpoIIE family protein phosphatase [Leptospiraceae bacterium]
MEALDFLNRHSIYLNYFAIGAIICFIFNFICGAFLLALPHKTKSTTHMGIGLMFMSFFVFGYVISQSFYSDIAAYHRWVTVGFVLPAIVHFVQWLLRFPENNKPGLTRWTGVAMWALSLGALALFMYASVGADRKFHFSAHYWDFDLEKASKYVGFLIFAFVLCMPGFGIWKFVIVKTKERYAIVLIIASLLIASVIPAILNIQSRDGVVERGTFLLVFVLTIVGGFFMVILTYMNTTKDRSTFMAKIVGITLVTFLVMMQGVSLVTMTDREEEYDALRVQYMLRALDGADVHPTIEYIVALEPVKKTIDQSYQSERYAQLPESKRVDFVAQTPALLNTRIFEEIQSASAQPQFRDAVANIVRDSHVEFAGYKAALEDAAKQAPNDDALKGSINDYMARLDKEAFINTNRISGIPSDSHFREELMKHLGKANKYFAFFVPGIQEYMKQNPDMPPVTLKKGILKYLARFSPDHTRVYRQSPDGNQHFVAFNVYDAGTGTMHEVGYSYQEYRAFVHPAAKRLVFILLIVLVVLVVLYPLFFRGSLVNPLNSLLRGVTKVNQGDLTVEVPVKVQDEIGFLTTSFNSMVASIKDARAKLEDYAANLEEKVQARTAELNKTLEVVHALKIQQDGDYFLTSLLAKPLFFNANKSRSVTTEFLLRQKKHFEFRNKQSELGGDICITGNLRFSKHPERRYVVSLNGDAMGKSMQGAGGSLVMGVVMNSILARSAKNNRVLTISPEQWLKDVYEEVHSVFLAFNGSMVISVVMSIVDEVTGEMWYWNAEHPFQILYRNGKASFIEEDLQLRKVGLESEIPFRVRNFQLQPGDVVLMGSDGRDDIDLTPDASTRTINEDEFLILKRVEESRADLNTILERLLATGELTDDLSFLRIEFKGVTAAGTSGPTESKPVAMAAPERVIIDIDPDDEDDMNFEDVEELGSFEELFQEGRRLARQGKHEEALELLRQAYAMRRDVPALNKILAVLTFKDRDYPKAIEILGNYLEHDPHVADFWLYLSIAHKRMGEYERSLEAAQKVYEINPNRIPNLINMADLYQKLGNASRAQELLDRALQLDPGNRQAQSLLTVIS